MNRESSSTFDIFEDADIDKKKNEKKKKRERNKKTKQKKKENILYDTFIFHLTHVYTYKKEERR